MLRLAKNLKWTFAPANGGRDTGFHEPGVDTYGGNFDRYLTRELIQNSLDARVDLTGKKPVRVKFDHLFLKQSEIPDLAGLQHHLHACSTYFTGDPRAREFFNRAAALARKPQISVLRVGDFHTSGVLGKDNERDKMWYSLIRCSGASSKRGTEGGSFGIGKNAPFAASKLRTVFYSTYNADKEHIFQGVAMLTSHEQKRDVLQPTGYLGGKGGESLRTRSDIPPTFLRKEQGTDVFILGFPYAEDWGADLTYSVLENFWPAIESGDLIVQVGSQQIDRKTLGPLLEQFNTAENFSAHLYHSSFKVPTEHFTEELPNLGEVSLFLRTGDDTLPKRIAMVRKTGMVIFQKPFRSVTPFSGVFICKNDAGNKLLRDMEPPKHDEWDPDLPEKGLSRTTEIEYTTFIRKCIRTLTKVDDAKVISIPGLSRFLPDEDELDEEFGGLPEERLDRKALPEKIKGNKIKLKGSNSQKHRAERARDEDEDFDVSVPPENPPKPPRPAIPIHYRAFSVDGSEYTVNVRPDDPKVKRFVVMLWAVGDDQRYPLKIRSAKSSSGSDLSMSLDGYIGPLKGARDGAPIKFVVTLPEPERIAMEVTAHEA